MSTNNPTQGNDLNEPLEKVAGDAQDGEQEQIRKAQEDRIRLRIDNVRIAKLKHLIETEFGGNAAQLAKRFRLGQSRYVQLNQWLNGKRRMGEVSARVFEEDCGKPWGWLDKPARKVPGGSKESPGQDDSGG